MIYLKYLIFPIINYYFSKIKINKTKYKLNLWGFIEGKKLINS